MAKPNLTSVQRLTVYQLIYQINRSFHLIVLRLSQAETLDMLTKQHASDMLGVTQEIQTEINSLLLDGLEDLELRDQAIFGKVRTAMEKRLKGQ